MIKIKNNVRKNELVFDGKVYVLNQKDLGTVPAMHTAFKGVNQVGEYKTNTTLEARDIVITGWVFADNKEQMKQCKRPLQRLLNPLDNFDLIVDDLKLQCELQGTPMFSPSYIENNNFISKFLINAHCPNPCFIPLIKSSVDVALWQPLFHFPLIIPQSKGVVMGLRSPSTIVNVNNDGDIQTGIIIEFKAKGTLANPSLLNVNTREFIKINKTMATGEIIKVNTNYGKKSAVSILNGVTTNIMNLWDLDGEFLQLNVGENLLRYDADSNVDNLNISVNFYPKYLGEES